MIKDKKAESAIVDFMAVLLFGIIVILLFVLFIAFGKDTQTSNTQDVFQSVDTDYVLIGMLNQEINFQGQNMPLKELIPLWSIETGNKRDKSKITEILEIYSQNALNEPMNNCYALGIAGQDFSPDPTTDEWNKFQDQGRFLKSIARSVVGISPLTFIKRQSQDDNNQLGTFVGSQAIIPGYNNEMIKVELYACEKLR